MASLQRYQMLPAAKKIPRDCKTYTTPTMEGLYATPPANEPGSWSINSNMVLVDLSHPWGNNQPTWPAGEIPYMRPVQYMAKFNRLTNLAWGMPEHVSTQYDAPSHVCQESPFVHEVPLEKFIAPCVALDLPCTPMETISVDRVKEACKKAGFQKGDNVIAVTGWHRLYSDSDRYFLWSPGMHWDAAEWLVEQGCSGFGIDTQALDHPCASYMAHHGPGPLVPRVLEYYEQFFPGRDAKKDFPYWEPVHEVFLSRNIPGYEDVGGDIDKVVGKRFVMCAFPSRWYLGDGSKVRMVAFIDKKDLNNVPDRVYKYGTY